MSIELTPKPAEDLSQILCDDFAAFQSLSPQNVLENLTLVPKGLPSLEVFERKSFIGAESKCDEENSKDKKHMRDCKP